MKAEAVMEAEGFTPKQLLLLFETRDQMAKFYSIFNHTAIVDRFLQDVGGARETRRELIRLLPDIDDLSQKHLNKLNRLLNDDWRDVEK